MCCIRRSVFINPRADLLVEKLSGVVAPNDARSLESDLWKRCWALCASLQRNWKQVALQVLESVVAFSLEKADLHLDGEHLPQ